MSKFSAFDDDDDDLFASLSSRKSMDDSDEDDFGDIDNDSSQFGMGMALGGINLEKPTSGKSSGGYGSLGSGMKDLDDLEDDDTEFYGDSGGDLTGSDSTQKDAIKSRDLQKTGIMLVGIGLAILVFVMVGVRVVNSIKTSSRGKEVVTIEENTQNNGGSQKPEAVKGNTSVKTGSGDGWTKISLSESPSFTTIESVFTITGLTHYAKVTSANNDKQLKTVVTGNISGLVGTYEVVLPSDKALKLGLGVSFKINYQVAEQNGYKVIGDISY